MTVVQIQAKWTSLWMIFFPLLSMHVIKSNAIEGFKQIILTLSFYNFIDRFSRMNRIFAGLWFGKGKPHFPTFLQPFAISLRTLYNPGNKIIFL